MTEGKSHNVPSASKEMVVITDFSLTFVAVRFAEKAENGDTHFSEDCAFSILQPHSSLFFLWPTNASLSEASAACVECAV